MHKNKKIPEICPIKHKTARSIVFEYFKKDYPNLSDYQLLKVETEFKVFLNEEWEYKATVLELLKTVKKNGIWGFCAHSKNPYYKEIHYWISKKATTEQVLELFVHETAHAIGNKSEYIAKKYAGVALFAYLIMKKNLKWKKW